MGMPLSFFEAAFVLDGFKRAKEEKEHQFWAVPILKQTLMVDLFGG